MTQKKHTKILIIDKDVWYNKWNINLRRSLPILISQEYEKQWFVKNNLIDSDGNMYLTFDSLININNNYIPRSNNINLRKVNIKPYGFDKMHINKDLIEDKL